MRTLLFLLLCSCFTGIQAQSWIWAQSTTGSMYSDEGLCVSSDRDGNSFLGGEYASPSMSFGPYTISQSSFCGDGFLVKYDPAGTPLWVKDIGCGEVYSIATDSLDNIYITGGYLGFANFGGCTLSNSGNEDIYIAKLDASGNCQWARTATGITGDRGYGIAVSPGGTVYVTGLYTSATLTFGTITLNNTAQGYVNIFLAKYDAAGNLKWVRNDGGSVDDHGYDIAIDTAENAYIVGDVSGNGNFGSLTYSAVGGYDAFLVKYDSAGTALWCRLYGAALAETNYSVSCDPSGNPVICGNFQSPSVLFGTQVLTNTSTNNNNDAFVAKIDANGNALWANSVNGTLSEAGYAVDVDDAGNIAFSGGFTSNQINYGTTTFNIPPASVDPSFLFKLDHLGNLLCSSVQNSGGDDQNDVAYDPSGNIFFGGDFYYVNPFILGNDSLQLDSLEDVFIAKYRNDCSFTEGVDESNTDPALTLYPNPGNGNFTVHSGILTLPLQLCIYNEFGQLVNQQDLTTSETTIDLHDNAAGMYFYTIAEDQKIIRSGKLIIR